MSTLGTKKKIPLAYILYLVYIFIFCINYTKIKEIIYERPDDLQRYVDGQKNDGTKKIIFLPVKSVTITTLKTKCLF